MPTYQYACTDCAEPLEVRQSFADDTLTVCPACEGRLRKVFNAVGVVFKGSGFYKTDSRRSESGAGSSGSGSETGSESGSGSGSGSGSAEGGSGKNKDATKDSSSGSSSSDKAGSPSKSTSSAA